MIGRVLLWVNGFVVPTVTAVYTLDWVGLIVGVVSLLNTAYIDFVVRPKIERVIKTAAKFLRAWE